MEITVHVQHSIAVSTYVGVVLSLCVLAILFAVLVCVGIPADLDHRGL